MQYPAIRARRASAQSDQVSPTRQDWISAFDPWRGSSAGQSGGIIIRRSPVRSRPPLPPTLEDLSLSHCVDFERTVPLVKTAAASSASRTRRWATWGTQRPRTASRLKQLLTYWKYCCGGDRTRSRTEKLMNAPTSSEAAEKSLPVSSDVEAEISRLVGQKIPRPLPQIETDAERIRSSVARLTSSSIGELGELTSELQELQEFLRSEVERVEGEIESALAGIKIIIETIAPWKSTPASLATPTSARPVRAGPAAILKPRKRVGERTLPLPRREQRGPSDLPDRPVSGARLPRRCESSPVERCAPRQEPARVLRHRGGDASFCRGIDGLAAIG